MSERERELEKGVSRGRAFCLSISLFICFCVHSRISKNFNLPKICAHMCVPCAPTHPLPPAAWHCPTPAPGTGTNTGTGTGESFALDFGFEVALVAVVERSDH